MSTPRELLDLDGAHGEGGGQLVRTAVALAAITGTPIRVRNVRARRDKPGLAPQHLAAVRAVAALCDARCEHLALRSTVLEFVPGALQAGEFAVDVGTAGSVTLVLQALLPPMICAPAPCRVQVTGGTDVRAAPPLDYFREVLAALLARMGIAIECTVRRRGYYPRGGGEVEVAVMPARPAPIALDQPGRLRSVEGHAHAGNLPGHIPQRMREAAERALKGATAPIRVKTSVVGEAEAVGQGGAIVVWAELANTVLGAGCVAERGVRAETLGESAGTALAADLATGATLDVHAADQVLVYLALAGGESSFAAREVSLHAETAMWLIGQFLPVKFEIARERGRARVRVSARA